MRAGSLVCPTLCDPVDCGLPGFSVREQVPRQEHRSVLANPGCRPLPETIFPAARAANPAEHLVLPEPLRPKQLPQLHACPHRANPSPPGQPPEQTPVDDPHAEEEIKPQVRPRSSVAEEEDPKPSHQPHKVQVKSAQSARQTLCLWEIWKVTESPHKGRRTRSGSCGRWRQERRGAGPDQTLSCPHSRSRGQHSVGGILGR